MLLVSRLLIQLSPAVTCWTVSVPAMRTKDAFQFARKFSSSTDSLAHLKRVKSSVTPQTATTIIQILLFPTSVMAEADITAALAASPLAQYVDERGVYVSEVPAGTARTDAQVQEWGTVWPVQIMHVREGAGAKVRQRGWERGKVGWLRAEVKKVWRDAVAAGEKGEVASACTVTESWDSQFHSADFPPTTIISTHDTRHSSGNILLHAASNAIDGIGLLDCSVSVAERASVRPPCPSIPTDPYLLTGLTVFTSHEPCLLCSMSLLHSRIKELYFVKRSPGAGGCGSVYRVHEDGGLNHRFEVWEWTEGALGQDLTLEVDP